MVVVVGPGDVVVVVVPLAGDPVTVSWEPAINSETVWPLRLGSVTRVTGPLSVDGQRRARPPLRLGP